MLYSFAITPEVFEPWFAPDGTAEGRILTELLRGLCDNGILADLHAGQWLTQVRRCLDNNKSPPDLRDKINSCLAVLSKRNRLVRHPASSERPETEEYRWLHWALERHGHDPEGSFQAIVSSEEFIAFSTLQSDALMPIQTILDAPCWLERKRSVRFEKTEANLRVLLAPIIRHASKLILIDPYMTCRKERFFETVRHATSLLGRHFDPPRKGRIDIHAGDPTEDKDGLCETVRERLDRWKTELGPEAKHFCKEFHVYLWGRKPGGKRFHDRYIITDQLGLGAPGGLDFGTDSLQANYTEWTWLEPCDVQEIVLTEFDKMKSPYRFLDMIKVLP